MTETMRHMLVKATVTAATDEGTFTAVISSVSVDRDDDIVEPAAVVKALQAWAPLGKMVPLSWNHEIDADHIIGHIVPSSVQETDAGEVSTDGWIDQSFDRGKHAWRLVKSGTLGFSYGYVVPAGGWVQRTDGRGKHITQMDIFEVTATPIPANADTRVLAWKSADVRREAEDARREAEQATLPDIPAGSTIPPPDPSPEPAPEPEPAPTAEEVRGDLSVVAKELARDARRDTPSAPPEPEPEPDPEPELAPEPVPTAEEVHDQMRVVTKELAQDAKRHAPPPSVDAMTKAFERFTPAGKTADQVAADLDGLTLDGGTLYVRLVDDAERAGVQDGHITAVWSAGYVNSLPDSAFLFVEAGGKDAEGKTTPRTNRYFPVKDADGTPDQPHLRNALARIPQATVPQDVKDRCAKSAQALLDRSTSVDETVKEEGAPGRGPRTVDPLVKEATALQTQFARDSFPTTHTPAAPVPVMDAPPPKVLRRQQYEEMLVHLRGELDG